ncbi:MAG: hypothetical protein ACXAD7_03005, partial [Candidatus Kariarchaeaceae archaeon]
TVFEYSEDRTELAYELGASEVIITSKELPKRLDRPLSIILNTVNKSLDWRSYMRLLDTKGTLCLLASALEFEIPYSSFVYQQKRITASVIAGRAELTETLDIAARFGIKAYIEEYALKDANLAIQNLKDGKLKYRAVIDIST